MRLIRLFLILTVWAAASFAPAGAPWPGAPGQPSGPALVVLNRRGQPVSRLTDGDRLQFQLHLPEMALAPLPVVFELDTPGAGLRVTACTVAIGHRQCTTEPVLSLGWYWAPGGQPRPQRALYARAGASALAVTRLQVAPRPVVMAHGVNSGWETWVNYLGPDGFLAPLGLAGYAVGDGQFPGAMNTGRLTDPTRRTNTLAENAAILRDYIADVKEATGAEMVDLVAHSMGGLISRYYISRLMEDRDVAQLTMLGTPNSGTECGSLPASLGMLIPATLEVQPAYIANIFNHQVTRRRGVPFHGLAGTYVVNLAASPCTRAPSDVVVSQESVGAIPLTLEAQPIFHGDMNLLPEVFEAFVKPRLQTPAGQLEAGPDPEPAAASSAPPPLQFTRVFTGHVPAGATQQHIINIDLNVAVAGFALFDPTRSLTVTVRGASGNVIQLDPVANGLIVVDDPASLVYLGYGFENPRPGAWDVTLHATPATPATGADYAFTAHLSGGAELQAQLSTVVPAPDEGVELTAELLVGGQPVTASEAVAWVRDPDGNQQQVRLEPDGTQYRATLQPELAGLHSVDVQFVGAAPDGSPIERVAFLAFEVQPDITPTGTYVALAGLAVAVLGAMALVALGAWRLLRRVARR